MTNRKSTKKALLTSFLCLLLCFSMLVGTTFAWFTDSVESGVNQIIAGNLDVEVYTEDGTSIVEENVLFDEIKLWEPGVVAYENLTVKNMGTLALKYQMSINFTNENTVDGYGLSQVLKVAVVPGGVSGTREEVLAAAGEGVLLSELVEYGELLTQDASQEYGIVIWWEPSEDDNNWNVNNGKKTSDGASYLHIDLGVKLVATQKNAESDSFGPDYDEALPVIVLPAGVTEESFGDNVAATADAEGNVTYYATLKGALEAIHAAAETGIATVAEEEAAPANVLYLKPGADLGTVTHAHVCSSLTVYGNGAYISAGEADFEVDTYKFCHVSSKVCAGLTGDLTLTIYNLGGVAVWGQRTSVHTVNINLYDCQDVNRVYISTADNSEFMGSVTNVTIDNCTYDGTTGYNNTAVYTNNPGALNISNTTIKGYVIGINQNNKSAGTQNINLTDCTFIDCATTTIADAANATAYAAPVRVVATSEETAVSNLTMTGCAFIYTGDETAVDGNVLTLDKRAGKQNNGTVNVVIDGVQIEAITTSKTELTTAVMDAINAGEKEIVVDAAGADIGDLQYAFGGKSTIIPEGTTVTIRNAVISDQSYGNMVNGTIIFENCSFNNADGAYSIHFADDNETATETGVVIFKNCYLAGWNSFGTGLKSVEFYGCTIEHNGHYGQLRFYQDAVLENCTIASNVTVDAGKDCDLVVTNSVVDDGSYITDVIYVDDCFDSITIDGKKTVYTQEALAEAVAENATVYLIGNDAYAKNGTNYDLKGIQKAGLTIIGLGDDVKMVNNTNYASGGRIGAIWQAINLENVTITNTVYTMADGGKSTFTNVTFAAGVRRAYGSNVVFTDCTFGSNSEGYALHFESDAASEGGNIVLNGCKFEGGKVHLGSKRTYTFTGCDFAAGTDFQVWSGITLDGCTVDGEKVTADNVSALFPALKLELVAIQ